MSRLELLDRVLLVELYLKSLSIPQKLLFGVDFLIVLFLEPYFFEGNVTADSYCSMIRNHVIPSLKRKRCFSTTIYQQDGAPAHTAFRTIEFLKEQFGAQLMCKTS